jgi:hypothetical protein
LLLRDLLVRLRSLLVLVRLLVELSWLGLLRPVVVVGDEWLRLLRLVLVRVLVPRA